MSRTTLATLGGAALGALGALIWLAPLDTPPPAPPTPVRMTIDCRPLSISLGGGGQAITPEEYTAITGVPCDVTPTP